MMTVPSCAVQQIQTLLSSRHASACWCPSCWVRVSLTTRCLLLHPPFLLPHFPYLKIRIAATNPDMEDYDVRSAASILASVKEQEARFEQLTRALEEERRNVTLQLERANMPPNAPNSQPLAWQQVVMQVNHNCAAPCSSALPNSHSASFFHQRELESSCLRDFFSVWFGKLTVIPVVRTSCPWYHSGWWWLQRRADEIKPPVPSPFASTACHWVPSSFAHILIECGRQCVGELSFF